LVITFAPGAGPRRRQLAISCADALELMTDHPVDPTRVNSLVDLFRCERPD
jgi:hypothetical protein